MDLNNIRIFSAIGHRMSYLSERQSVIAQNIANSNTPGYQPKDLKKLDFNEMVNKQSGGLQMSATSVGHIQMGAGSSGQFAQTGQKLSFDITPTGNAVVLSEQMFKLNETAHSYEATLSLYKKMTGLLSVAIGDRQ